MEPVVGGVIGGVPELWGGEGFCGGDLGDVGNEKGAGDC